jgi:hypothetical protein
MSRRHGLPSPLGQPGGSTCGGTGAVEVTDGLDHPAQASIGITPAKMLSITQWLGPNIANPGPHAPILTRPSHSCWSHVSGSGSGSEVRSV